MLENPKVSITVPVYNQESLLHRCIDSLINQSLPDIEIILVDDGSTDSSPEICDQYAKKDARIKVIHKKNGGSASARQAAMNILTGDYFTVCDSDDWVESTMYEELYKLATTQSSDIAICGFYYDYPDGTTIVHCPDPDSALDGNVLNNLLLEKFPSSTCDKLIKTDFVRKNKIQYIEGINLGEDFLFSVQCAMNNATYSFLRIPFYHYLRRIGENTYTNHLTINSYYQLVNAIFWVESHIDSKKYDKGLFHRNVNLAFSAMRTDGMTSKILKETVLNKLSHKDFLRYKSFSVKVLYVYVVKLFGYHVGRSLIKIAYKYFYH